MTPDDAKTAPAAETPPAPPAPPARRPSLADLPQLWARTRTRTRARWEALPVLRMVPARHAWTAARAAAFAALGLALFYAGFRSAFPGRVAAMQIQQQLAAHAGLPAEVAPIELSGASASIRRLALLPPPDLGDTGLSEVLTFEDIRAPLAALLGGRLELLAEAYGGQVAADAGLEGPIGFGFRGVPLERVPLVNLIPMALVRGDASLLATMTNLPAVLENPRTPPEGHADLKVVDLQVRFREDAEAALGIKPPDLAFSEARLSVAYGPTVRVDRLALIGSLTGSVVGRVELDPNRAGDSKYRFDLDLKVAEGLMAQLGPMAALLETMMCGDRIFAEVSGSFNSFNTPIRKACP